MATLPDLEAVLLARLRRNAPAALDAYGTALAAAIAAEAPVATGALRASVGYEPDSDTAGAIVLRKYGIYVDRGHKVARYRTSTRPRAQSRPFKTRGVVPPNPFIERGKQGASLGAAKAALVAALAKG